VCVSVSVCVSVCVCECVRACVCMCLFGDTSSMHMKFEFLREVTIKLLYFGMTRGSH
jgi:hypothetical protein